MSALDGKQMATSLITDFLSAIVMPKISLLPFFLHSDYDKIVSDAAVPQTANSHKIEGIMISKNNYKRTEETEFPAPFNSWSENI